MSEPDTETLSGSAILKRMKEGLGVRYDTDICRHFGYKKSRVAKWKLADARPYKECVQLSLETDLNLTWLLTGRGPMRDPPPAAAPPAGRYDLAAAEERLEGFRAWLQEWWTEAEIDYKWWFLTQLRRCFEEYDQRLSADKKDADPE